MVPQPDIELKGGWSISSGGQAVKIKISIQLLNSISPCEFTLPNEIDCVSISHYSNLLTSWLLEIENKTASKCYKHHAAFGELFADVNYTKDEIEQLISLAPRDYRQPDWFLLAAFYKGLFVYLNDGERWKRYDAAIMRLYAAWQWYHFIKSFDKPSPTRLNDIIEAHLVLSRLLESGEWEYSGAARSLATKIPQIDPSALVYRMRLQMVIDSHPNPSVPVLPVFSPPELYQEPSWLKGMIHWDSREENEYAVRLHDLFKSEHQGAAALRTLVTEWALKRYDFDTALRLANLQTGRRLNLGNFSLAMSLILVTSISLSTVITASSSLAVRSGGIYMPWTTQCLFLLGQWAVIIAMLFGFGWVFGRRLLGRFGLPRLLGGIFIGYSAMILQGDSALLSSVLWSNGWPVIAVLWAAVVAAGGYYLYNDIQPYTGNPRETARRILWSLLIFILFSAVIGLFLMPIYTLAFADQSFSPLPRLIFLGPAGWVDLYHFLAFIPMALFVGLVTQFLFEEKTITTSVWPLER